MPRHTLDDFPDLPWCGQYILGGEDGHTPVPCYSLLQWGQMLQSMDRIVARTGNDIKWVSTVFLGLDHRHWGGGPPLVFESMAFVYEGRTMSFFEGGPPEPVPETLDQRRYSSWDDAEIGHKAMVRKYLINAKTRVKAAEG